MEHTMSKPSALSIVVIGASGDLAVKKIFPALFALYCRKLLPETFTCHGFARSPMSDEQFRDRLKEHLTCRYTPGETACRQYMEAFLNRCFYNPGQNHQRGELNLHPSPCFCCIPENEYSGKM